MLSASSALNFTEYLKKCSYPLQSEDGYGECYTVGAMSTSLRFASLLSHDRGNDEITGGNVQESGFFDRVPWKLTSGS